MERRRRKDRKASGGGRKRDGEKMRQMSLSSSSPPFPKSKFLSTSVCLRLLPSTVQTLTHESCRPMGTGTIFTRDSVAIARICHGNSVCPSDCLSVTRVDQSKTVEARITQFSPYSRPSLQFFGGKFHPEILRASPRAEASNKGGVGKISHFLPLSVNISKTVPDTTKVTIDH